MTSRQSTVFRMVNKQNVHLGAVNLGKERVVWRWYKSRRGEKGRNHEGGSATL